VEPEDVVHVLRNMVAAVKPGGVVLDLQVLIVNPRAEAGGRLVCELDGTPLFLKAEVAVDDHDVLKHYAHGADLVDDWARSGRRPLGLSDEELRSFDKPCVTRERCRLRRLRRTS
jgi:hypothetical protein